MSRRVKHWRMPDATKTLCGLVPKDREVDLAWPVCKNCDRSKLLKYATRTFTLTPEQIAAQQEELKGKLLPNGEVPIAGVVFTSFSVTRIRETAKV